MIPQFKQEMRVSPEHFTEWSIRYIPLTAAWLQGNVINMQKNYQLLFNMKTQH